MKTGERDRLITVQTATATVDAAGGETLEWADVQQAWARVRFGNAQEKREAAQEGGQQSATFEVLQTAALRAVTLKDRIWFDDSGTWIEGDSEPVWDITEVAPLDRQTLRLTAVRSR